MQGLKRSFAFFLIGAAGLIVSFDGDRVLATDSSPLTDMNRTAVPAHDDVRKSAGFGDLSGDAGQDFLVSGAEEDTLQLTLVSETGKAMRPSANGSVDASHDQQCRDLPAAWRLSFCNTTAEMSQLEGKDQ